ncbi:hypothetical protein [Pseudoflavitalea rhizosphaerae]|uniref:hypothetical protein n=1 Tax=Pseudoflavitalea rhizosphaerae TaxID=1884793 RepID=UPI000F8DC515|nr:hypothetical protein [Pseudoflavitalea rhizosphaerae]
MEAFFSDLPGSILIVQEPVCEKAERWKEMIVQHAQNSLVPFPESQEQQCWGWQERKTCPGRDLVHYGKIVVK